LALPTVPARASLSDHRSASAKDEAMEQVCLWPAVPMALRSARMWHRAEAALVWGVLSEHT
jgi:hypothetical protein